MSEIPKFEDWSRRRQVLDDEHDHLIPLRPLDGDDHPERIIGWGALAAVFWILVVVAWKHLHR